MLNVETADTNKDQLLVQLEMSTYNAESSSSYLQKALALADKINYSKGKLIVVHRLRYGHRLSADYQKAIDFGLKTITLAEEIKDTSGLFDSYFQMISVYSELKDTKTSTAYLKKQ